MAKRVAKDKDTEQTLDDIGSRGSAQGDKIEHK